MKMQLKSLSFILTLCILLGGLGSACLTAFATSPELNEQSFNVKFRQVINVTDSASEDSEILELAMEAGAVTGWTYNVAEQRFERMVSYDAVSVTVNGEDVTPDKNGTFRFLNRTNETFTVVVHDPMIDKTYTQLIGGESTNSSIVIDLDISKMFSIDVDNETLEKDPLTKASPTNPYWSDGEPGVYGYRLHCNRFNGWLGNGRYYSGRIDLRAILNFFASDCDWALGSYSYYLADYGPNPYCSAYPDSKQARCSTLMNHYNRFHMHTSYFR